jgi:hypothetical protein
MATRYKMFQTVYLNSDRTRSRIVVEIVKGKLATVGAGLGKHKERLPDRYKLSDGKWYYDGDFTSTYFAD